MNEELQALFESSVLNDETKQALQEAFNNAVEAKRVEVESDYEQKLKEQYSEITALVPELIEEAVADNLEELAEEVNEARSLEVTYAEKLEQFKENYSEKADEFIQEAVAEIVAEEVSELKEDIDLARKHQFAIKVTEAFGDVYQEMFGQADFDVATELKEAKAELDQYKREAKMAELLEGVSGSKRKVAQTILEGVSVDRMEDKFEALRGYLTESGEPAADKDEETLNESDKGSKEEEAGTVVLENHDESDKASSKISENAANAISKSLKMIR